MYTLLNHHLKMKLSIKMFFLIGVFSILTGSLLLASVEDGTLYTRKSYPLSSIKNLQVSTSGGSISVMGDANREAVLEMYVRPNNNRRLSDSEIQKILDRDYEIIIERQGNTLVAIAKRKSGLNWRNAINISFVVHTGSSVSSDLSTSGGSIQLARLQGDQKFKTSGGSLKIQHLKGNIDGKTSGGSIQASYSEGMIGLKTSGGSITLDNVQGDVNVSTSGGSIKGSMITGSLAAKTSGGSIQLNELACSLSASTSGGSVTAELDKLVGDLRLATSAGSINLRLPKNASADLDLKGSRVNAGNLSNFRGSNAKGSMVGSINGGGPKVQASTSAGSVNLSFR